MARNKTVSIVTPAYNEVGNIENQLRSIIRQKFTGYKLKEILVACDGCSDGTEKLLTKLQKELKVLRVIKGTKRKGKCYRLNQLYQRALGDYVVQIDADGVLEGNNCILSLLTKLKDKRVMLVSANNLPVTANGLFEDLMNTVYLLWYEIRKSYKGGDNIFNFHGMMGAMPRDFAKSVHYPKGLFADQHFLYARAKKIGKFVFVPKAVIRFRSPNNIKDFLLQAKRSLKDRSSVAEFLGEEVLELFEVDWKYKYTQMLNFWLNKPIKTSLGICLLIWLRFMPSSQNFLVERGVWKVSKSTKLSVVTG